MELKKKVKEPKMKKVKPVNVKKDINTKPKVKKPKGMNFYAVLVGCSLIPLIISRVIISVF